MVRSFKIAFDSPQANFPEPKFFWNITTVEPAISYGVPDSAPTIFKLTWLSALDLSAGESSAPERTSYGAFRLRNNSRITGPPATTATITSDEKITRLPDIYEKSIARRPRRLPACSQHRASTCQSGEGADVMAVLILQQHDQVLLSSNVKFLSASVIHASRYL